MKLIAICFTLGLTACTGALDFSHQAIEGKKQFNDGQADLYKQVPCDMTLGAYFRRLNDAERAAVDLLCGGNILPVSNPVTE